MNKVDYSLSERIQLGVSWFYTAIVWNQAKLVRLPCKIRGKRGIHYEKGLSLGYMCRIECSNGRKTLFIGERTIIGDLAHIVANESVTIGNEVLIASRVFISDTSHGNYNENLGRISEPCIPPNDRNLFTRRVSIGDKCWIGENVSILPGSSIGSGSIIGANAVVTGTVPPFSIAVGSPCKVIKKYDFNTKKWFSI